MVAVRPEREENAERERISVRMHLCAGVYEGRGREREDGRNDRKEEGLLEACGLGWEDGVVT